MTFFLAANSRTQNAPRALVEHLVYAMYHVKYGRLYFTVRFYAQQPDGVAQRALAAPEGSARRRLVVGVTNPSPECCLLSGSPAGAPQHLLAPASERPQSRGSNVGAACGLRAIDPRESTPITPVQPNIGLTRLFSP